MKGKEMNYYAFEDRYENEIVVNSDNVRIGTLYIFDSKLKRDNWIKADINRRSYVDCKYARKFILDVVRDKANIGHMYSVVNSHTSTKELNDYYIEFCYELGGNVFNSID